MATDRDSQMGVEELLASILPSSIEVAAAEVDPPGVPLFPEEQRVIARAVTKRCKEFTTVRMCARRALARFGVAPVPLVPGPRGSPVWPIGFVGSMTHCRGFRGAAVTRATEWCGVGIDAEPHEHLSTDVLEMIALTSERKMVRALARSRPRVCWDRLLFCLKESVYKAWYPWTSQSLGFEDARIEIDPDAGTFEVQVLCPCPVQAARRVIAGHWSIGRGLIVCGAVIPRTNANPDVEDCPCPDGKPQPA